MLPRIIKEQVTELTIAMPLPEAVPKNRNSISEWQSNYKTEEQAFKTLEELKHYNIKLFDVIINWRRHEYNFVIAFNSEEDVEKFKTAVQNI